ncbi:LysM peptidoglycan-binding domain-containing protein [Caloramator sp. mosi_1]|uniref:cell division suppressor protein YneA n=1 Tax=Caloramator sp. mosi_1 TaxID=3023090 RepID=UPI002362D818|nr:LysM peptidoglycan-binding domain-containing protein [Caloramator sp. mosi_1]WDC83945.1 LysM peptidoglycan-binding domain-containing protein [Caloramator sp. mosi_1]WDC83983.1 LysM peptidoglycan-binding domain-containing protein [Caloramator sp. mosi_1]
MRKLLKTLLSFTLFFLIISLSISKVSSYYKNNKQNKITTYEEIVVNKGDTLWKISIKHTPKDKDVRKTIYEIRKINNLNDCIIYPGQVLKVPIDK